MINRNNQDYTENPNYISNKLFLDFHERISKQGINRFLIETMGRMIEKRENPNIFRHMTLIKNMLPKRHHRYVSYIVLSTYELTRQAYIESKEKEAEREAVREQMEMRRIGEGLFDLEEPELLIPSEKFREEIKDFINL